MNFIKGDVVRVNLGTLMDGVVGSEQASIRPCVILQTFHHLGLIIIIPLTTKKKHYFNSSIYPLEKGSGGLKQISYALCHQMRTISTERIIEKIGTLNIKDFNALVMVVKVTLF